MKILVAYDGSSSAGAAIEDLNRAGLPVQADALIVCVAGDGRGPHEPGSEDDEAASWRSRLAEAEHLAKSAADRIQAAFPNWTVSSKAFWGSPAKVILDASKRWQPDLIISGSHGRSRVARLFLGSVSLELVHKGPCALRIARLCEGSRRGRPIRIVIGTDGSVEAAAVIRSVAARSWPERTEVEIVSAIQTLVPVMTALEASTYAQEPAFSVIREADERERSRIRNVVEDAASLLRNAGLTVKCRVVEGDPREVIVAAAELSHADTIFVGARGQGRMRLLLGNVSGYVVTHAPCSVEIVRRPDWGEQEIRVKAG
jgi:nucleotide-binding universal stress UspA family protein